MAARGHSSYILISLHLDSQLPPRKTVDLGRGGRDQNSQPFSGLEPQTLRFHMFVYSHEGS